MRLVGALGVVGLPRTLPAKVQWHQMGGVRACGRQMVVASPLSMPVQLEQGAVVVVLVNSPLSALAGHLPWRLVVGLMEVACFLVGEGHQRMDTVRVGLLIAEGRPGVFFVSQAR
jgi:hypothetical protein